MIGPLKFDFGPMAQDYDAWYETRVGRRYDWLEKRIIRRFLKKVTPGTELLEIGSGSGWWSQFFSDLGFELMGIDISSDIIEQARKKNIPRTRFIRADALNTGIKDHCFAVTAAITSIEFTGHPELVVKEMARVTRPGGVMILGVLNSDAPLNRERRKKPGSPFSKARFFNMEGLGLLLRPFGDCRIVPCGFPLSLKLPRFLSGICDDLMPRAGNKTGAFLAARVRMKKSNS